MAQGYLLPASIYLGGASGLLTPNFYVPNTNTNAFGDLEGIQVVASLGSDASASLKFFMPNPIPIGTLKLRSLFQANISVSSVIKYTVKDGNSSTQGAGANPGAATLTTETQQTLTWSTGDSIQEIKLALTGISGATAGDLIIVGITFNTSGWTLAQILNSVHMLVWE